MPAVETHDIRLTLHCHTLPPVTGGNYSDLHLGPQDGDNVTGEVPVTVGEKTFTVPITVRIKPASGELDFGGPFVQGKPGERFVYLCWMGRDADGNAIRPGRVKVPLARLDRAKVLAAIHSGATLGFSLRLTDKRGGPACATLPPDAMEPL